MRYVLILLACLLVSPQSMAQDYQPIRSPYSSALQDACRLTDSDMAYIGRMSRGLAPGEYSILLPNDAKVWYTVDKDGKVEALIPPEYRPQYTTFPGGVAVPVAPKKPKSVMRRVVNGLGMCAFIPIAVGGAALMAQDGGGYYDNNCQPGYQYIWSPDEPTFEIIHPQGLR